MQFPMWNSELTESVLRVIDSTRHQDVYFKRKWLILFNLKTTKPDMKQNREHLSHHCREQLTVEGSDGGHVWRRHHYLKQASELSQSYKKGEVLKRFRIDRQEVVWTLMNQTNFWKEGKRKGRNGSQRCDSRVHEDREREEKEVSFHRRETPQRCSDDKENMITLTS